MRITRGDIGGPIDEAVLATFGLQMEQDAGGIDVWPENEQSVRAFVAMGTQWNVAMGGVVGLRYEALPAIFELLGIDPAERAAVFNGLRIMEHAALTELNHGRQ